MKNLIQAVKSLRGMGLGFGIGVATLFLGACSKPVAPALAAVPIPVTVAPVVQEDVPQYVDSIGYATAYEAVSIVAQVNGQIIKIGFQQGALVKKGDVLFQIDPRPYQAALDQANGQLASDQAALVVAQSQVERSRSLAATDLVAQQTFETYQGKVKELQASIETDNGTILAAQVNLDYCTVTAPVDGVVGLYDVNLGNVVFSKNQTILTTVMRIEPIYLDFTVTAAQLPEVRAKYAAGGNQLPLMAAYLAGDDPWTNATLKFLSNQVDQMTSTVLVRGVYENADTHFWAGQPIRVRLILQTLVNALLVPAEAVTLGQNGNYVFVKNADNTVSQALVTVGERESGNYIITSGLKAGQEVVVTGQYMLKEGAKVQVVTPLSGNLTTAGATAEASAGNLTGAGNATAVGSP
jgi:multidrug efflux system membrane fusion protein